MKLLVLCLIGVATLIGATSGMSVHDRHFVDILRQPKNNDRAFEDELRALLERIREIMGTGDPDNNIPVIDPFEYDELDLNFTIPNTADINLEVRDIFLEGLQGFEVDHISFTLGRLRLDYDLNIPSIKCALGQYKLLAKIIDYLFYGDGDGDVELNDLRFSGFATVTIRNGYLFMNNFQVKIELGAFKSNISGLLGGGEVSDVINKILETLVPALIETQGETLSAAVAELVVDFANEYLTQLTLSDLINIITGGGTTTAAPQLLR